MERSRARPGRCERSARIGPRRSGAIIRLLRRASPGVSASKADAVSVEAMKAAPQTSTERSRDGMRFGQIATATAGRHHGGATSRRPRSHGQSDEPALGSRARTGSGGRAPLRTGFRGVGPPTYQPTPSWPFLGLAAQAGGRSSSRGGVPVRALSRAGARPSRETRELSLTPRSDAHSRPIFYSLSQRRCYARRGMDRPAGRHAGLRPCFHVLLSAAWKRGHAQANDRHSSRVFAMPARGFAQTTRNR